MEKFENHSFIVEVTKEPGCHIVLDVKVKPEHVQKCHKKAIKKVNKQISIPGFRKGRAPDSVVLSRYDSYVDGEWKETLLQEALSAGFALSNIYPLNKESLEKPKLESVSLEEGATFVFAYEHYPEVPEIDFSKIDLPEVEKAAVSQEDVDEVIKQVQKSYAEFEDIEGRAIERGDYVDLTIDAIDRDPPVSIVKDRRFPIEEGVMAPWMMNLLIGKHVGDEVEGMSEPDPKSENRDFQATRVRIKIRGIKKILLPELDDELAKKAGAASTEELLEKIKENLAREAEEARKQKQIHALEEALLEHFQFDLPTSVVEGERQHRLKERIRVLKMQNLDDAEIKKREEEIERDVASSLEGDLRLYFINKQIEKQGNISLSTQELNDELVHQIMSNPEYQKQVLDRETSGELISRLSTSLIRKKTKEYALSQVLENSLTQ